MKASKPRFIALTNIPNLLTFLIMFARHLKYLTRALPLSLALGANLFSYQQIQLATPLNESTKIKFISDIGQYI